MTSLSLESLKDIYFRLPWPLGLLPLFIAFSVLHTAILYWLQRTLSPGRRLVLAALRAVAFTLICLLLFQPAARMTKTVVIPTNVLVLVDVSGSMNLKDPRERPEDLEDAAKALGKLGFGKRGLPDELKSQVAEAPRLELAKALLNHPELALFNQASEQYRVRYFTFGERLEAVAGEAGAQRDTMMKLEAKAEMTRLGEAIEEAVSRYAGQPIAGVIVLTDGGANAGSDALLVAENLKTKGIPLRLIGLGLPKPRDLRLKTFIAPEIVFHKDRAKVSIEIESHGYADRSVELTLLADGHKLASKAVELNGATQFEELAFVPDQHKELAISPEQKSKPVRLEASVSTLMGETVATNNQTERTTTISTQKVKVLYIEGKPRWEYRYLRAVLLRDHRLEVKFLMTEGDRDLGNASGQYLNRFPEKESELFEYDLVILGDVSPEYFKVGDKYPALELVEKLVQERGGTFLMLAGWQFAPTAYRDTPVASLLPIRLSSSPGRERLAPGVYPAITRAGAKSFMALTDPPQTLEKSPDWDRWEKTNQQAWSVVWPLYDVPRLDGAKPGARVLATLEDGVKRPEPYPLIAWQRYGTGKTLFVGSDQLWRIRFKRGDEYHTRFWGQAIQFMTLSRLLGENHRIQIMAEKKNLRAGERVAVTATVLNDLFQPDQRASYVVEVETPQGGEPLKLELGPVPGIPGVFQGFYIPEQVGNHRLRPILTERNLANTVELEVTAGNRELLDPAMRSDLFKEMAAKSGGKLLAMDQLPTLSGLVEGKSSTSKVEYDEEFWNRWEIYVILVGLLALEWLLRRRWDLA